MQQKLGLGVVHMRLLLGLTPSEKETNFTEERSRSLARCLLVLGQDRTTKRGRQAGRQTKLVRKVRRKERGCQDRAEEYKWLLGSSLWLHRSLRARTIEPQSYSAHNARFGDTRT